MSGLGYVYLIEADGPCKGMYKIGKSNNPEKRINDLTITPFEIKIIHTINCKNPLGTEARLHKFFGSYRIRGEWFSLTPIQVKMITAYKSESKLLAAIDKQESNREKITRIHLNALVGARVDKGLPSSWTYIAKETGIRKQTLMALSSQHLEFWKPEYAEPLCAFFGITIDKLLTIELPIQAIRPDRKGARVGEKTKEE